MLKKLFESFLSFVFPLPFPSEKIDFFPTAPKIASQWIYPCFDYHNPEVKKFIYLIKKRSYQNYDKKIAEHMYLALLETIAEYRNFELFKNIIIIPIPLSKKRKQERGFNQNEKISYYLAERIPGTQAKPWLLEKNRETKKQALILKKSERLKNIKQSFMVPTKYLPEIQGKDIILIDDLVTTGATLSEAKKVLEKNGARKIIASTIAH